MNPQDRKACELAIEQMRAASGVFYRLATAVGNHAFIEFTGLMNEYINMCRATLEKGVDFRMASTHSGTSLAMEPHHAAYLGEKLDCIYGPAMEDRQRRLAFMRAFLGER